jgi:hypothetical protein
MMRFSLYGAAIALALVAPGRAANIQVLNDPNFNAIAITGQIEPNDFEVFKRKVSQLSGRHPVVLGSPGGSLLDALQIGEYIRLKGWPTVAVEECDSACAAIWLAGMPRGIVQGAKVGFHAASSANGKEKGNGNAVFGAYMTRLGFGYEAVYWATTASPNDIAYLTPAKAKELGIDMDVIEPEDKDAPPAKPPPPPARLSQPQMSRSMTTFVVPSKPSAAAPAQPPTSSILHVPYSPVPPLSAGRDCSRTSQEIRDFFPQFFADCDPKTVKTTPTFAYNFVTTKVWDRYVQSSGRYLTRTLQACEGCAGAPTDSLQSQRNVYRLIAKMNGVNGEPPDGSVCWFTPQGWSDCENTAGEHYRLQAGSIRSFVSIALGVTEP